MTEKINGKTSEEIKLRLACIFAQDSGWCENQESCEKCEYNVSAIYTEGEVARDVLVLIQQLERERDELKNKPMAWEDVIMSDSFLEVKDEYVGAALLQCAFSHDEYCADDEVTFTTHLNDLKIYYRSEYGKSWRCWPRFPTDEERAAAKWEVDENAQESP